MDELIIKLLPIIGGIILFFLIIKVVNSSKNKKKDKKNITHSNNSYENQPLKSEITHKDNINNSDKDENSIKETLPEINLKEYISLVESFFSSTKNLKEELKKSIGPDKGYFEPVSLNFDLGNYKKLIEKINIYEDKILKKYLSKTEFKHFKKYYLIRLNTYLSLEEKYREVLGL